jgi:hypothetical protein
MYSGETQENQNRLKAAELYHISCPIPTVALAASVPVIGAIAFVVNKFLEAWEKIEKIRRIRAELAEIGMKGKAVDELTEQVTSTVEEVIQESVQHVLLKYPGEDNRKNELANAIRTDTRRLFGQIERGLTVELRAVPKKDADAAQQNALNEISRLARTMQFPEISVAPMLLKGEEILEGELHTVKQTKKTTTHKTTTVTKKDSAE